MSILRGVGTLTDRWLGIEPIGRAPHYRHKTAALSLSNKALDEQKTPWFFRACLSQIDTNWMAARKAGLANPSKQNWRWKRHPVIQDENRSPEIILERRIVSCCGPDWSNQMPTASGLAGTHSDKRGAVDLVQRITPTEYSFIELKVDSDNPLYAAVEVLIYGLLFVWSKRNLEALEYDPSVQPVLSAERIHLKVLAPGAFYDGYQLGEFGNSLDRCLALFSKESDLDMDFCFLELSEVPKLNANGNVVRQIVRSAQLAMIH
jgi:hypothetical protein